MCQVSEKKGERKKVWKERERERSVLLGTHPVNHAHTHTHTDRARSNEIT